MALLIKQDIILIPGSDIRMSLSQTGGSGSKTTSWRSLLSDMGTVKINYTTTTVTGSGSSTNARGWYDMTTSHLKYSN